MRYQPFAHWFPALQTSTTRAFNRSRSILFDARRLWPVGAHMDVICHSSILINEKFNNLTLVSIDGITSNPLSTLIVIIVRP